MQTKFEILREMFETSRRENLGATVISVADGQHNNFALTIEIKPANETAKGARQKASRKNLRI